MNACHEAARAYLAMGLHPIPCAPRSKRPLVEWRPYQRDAPLPEEIDTWWSQWPDANVALVLGRGTFAVDLDGGAAAQRLLFEQGILLPGAPRSRTGHGQHVFLSAPGHVPDRVGLLTTNGKKPQVDIRGVGIVVAPPSIHPDGPRYEWEVPLTWPLPPAPSELLDLIHGQRLPGPVSGGGGVGSSWVLEALHGVGEGQRDVTCTRLAGYFLGVGLDAATVEALLLDGFAQHCTPPLDPASVRKCVRSIDRREVLAGSRDRQGLRPVPLGAVLDQLESSMRAGPAPVLRTPFAKLNRVLGGGYQAGEFVLLGARPGVGKTALALQISRGAAEDGSAVLVVSREMVNLALARRLLAQASGVSASALKRADFTLIEHEKVERTLRELRGLPVWLTDEAISVGEVSTMVTGWAGPPLGLLVVDYLQLVRAPADIKERRLQVEAVSQALKTLAVTCRLPVLCLSSLARPGRDQEGRRPTLSDLRESGELEHDADVVLFLHRGMLDTKAECIVSKNRDGAVGVIDMTFTPETLRFEEIA
jgi:hypothetical protein